MISIIISSANAEHLKAVLQNIEETIGVAYEVISIDNSSGAKGICEIYNQSARQAKYDILCFIHEDIIIDSKNWGPALINSFAADPELGLLGIAGTGYKALAPSGWESYADIAVYMRIIQSYKYAGGETLIINENPTGEKLPRVTCVDGVWLSTKKSVVLEFPFDEQLLKGFHCYDLDISFSIGQKYKVAITYDILLQHFSEGNYDKTWIDENLKLHRKWHKLFPLNIQRFTTKQVITAEKETYRRFVEKLISFNYPAKTAYELLWYGNSYVRLSLSLFLKLNFYTFKRYLKTTRV